MAATPVQVDALYTTIGMDASDFLKKSEAVVTAFNEVMAKANSFAFIISSTLASASASASTSMQNIATSVSGSGGVVPALKAINAPLDEFSRSAARLGKSGQGLGLFNTALTSLFNNLPNVAPAATSLANIGKFLDGVAKVSPAKIPKVAPKLEDFANAFTSFAGKMATADVGAASLAYSRIGFFLQSAQRFKLDPVGLQVIAHTMNFLQGTLGAMSAINATPAIESMRALSRFMNATNRFNAGNMTTAVNGVKNAMSALSQIPVSASVKQLANVMTQISAASRGMARARNIGTGQINLQSTASGIGRTGTAARSAAAGTAEFGGALRSLASVAGVSDRALRALRFSMGAFSVVGLAMFAREDEALTRTMAHMGKFDSAEDFKATREFFAKGIQDISNSSSTGVVPLAKSLDTLTSAGFNATAAIKGLALAEQFSVASGIPMEKATGHLKNILMGMDLLTDKPEDVYKSMGKIQDLIVGMAAKSGSTDEQLSSAFTGRYMTALKQTNLGLEEGIALLSIYSRAGGDAFRGAGGGNSAAKALQGVLATVSGKGQFANMMAMTGVYEPGTKKVRSMVDVLMALHNELDGIKTVEEKEAKLLLLGFDAKKMIPDLLPLMAGMGKFKELRAEMEKMEGESKRVADMMRGSITHQMKQLWNNVSNVAIAFGDRLAPALSYVSGGIQRASKAFLSLHPAMQSLIVYGGLAVSVLGALRIPFVANSIIAIGSAIGGLVLAPFRLMYSLLSGMVSAAISLGSSLWSAAKMGWSGLKTMWGWMETIGGYAKKVFTAPLRAVEYVADNIGGALRKAFDIAEAGVVAIYNGLGHVIWAMTHLGDAAAIVGKAMLSAFLGIVPFLINLVGTILMISAASMLIVPLLAAIGAVIGSVVVTSAMALNSAFGAAADGVKSLWHSTKSGAAEALDYGIAKVDELHKGFVVTWRDAKKGALEFFDAAIIGFQKTAGFFWNFQHNLQVIVGWMGTNWREAILDVGTVTAFVFENIGNNFLTLVSLIKLWAADAFRVVWAALSTYASAAFGWLGNNWKNILSDMKMLFMAFVESLIHNFSQLFTYLKELPTSFLKLEEDRRVLEAYTYKTGPLKGQVYGPGFKAQDAISAEEARMKRIKDAAVVNFKGPEDFLARKTVVSPYDAKSPWKEGSDADMRSRTKSVVDWKTQWGDLGKDMGSATDTLSKAVNPIFANMTGTMIEALNDMKMPWMENIKFLAKWADLSKDIKTDMPLADLLKNAEDRIKRGVGIAPEGGNMQDAVGKSNLAGGSFKSISLERTMVNGPAAESLDYQQLVTMRQIRDDIHKMANAKGWEGGIAPPPNMQSVVGP